LAETPLTEQKNDLRDIKPDRHETKPTESGSAEPAKQPNPTESGTAEPAKQPNPTAGGTTPTKRHGHKHARKRTRKVTSRDIKAAALDWLRCVAIAFVIALVIMQFIKPTLVKQHSMEPNFYSDDYLLVSKQAYRLFGKTPKRGDVIVFRVSEGSESKLLIKRVIALPGEIVTIKDGCVYIDGELLTETYTKGTYTSGDINVRVPEESVFVLGDNRAVSIDSRSDTVGFVSFDSIVGKVFFRLSPLSRAGRIKNPFDD
jgi:signal peptidase I